MTGALHSGFDRNPNYIHQLLYCRDEGWASKADQGGEIVKFILQSSSSFDISLLIGGVYSYSYPGEDVCVWSEACLLYTSDAADE